MLASGIKHALLLQGPVGPFFRRLADELGEHGVQVTKVNFNAGDALFFRGPDVIPFRKKMEIWPAFFEDLLQQRGVDAVFLFGDCRPLHRESIRVAKKRGVAVWVFEEGYLRSDHITLERGGVNGNSSMSKDPEFYRREAAKMSDLPRPISIGSTFRAHAWYAIFNALAVTFLGWRYPHYRHHRKINVFAQAFFWVRGLFRKYYYRFRERRVMQRCTGEWSGRFFLVPLQVYCDSQIEHSKYKSVPGFIDEVVDTFARYAPADSFLVVKHHPLDRPYRDYSRLLRRLSREHGCADRLVYIHDLHLPKLLGHTRGVVTVNSTVGTQSLQAGKPVKVMGTAVYDIPGITSQAPLREFFAHPGEVDNVLFDSFRRWLQHSNQINGSFYKVVPGLPVILGTEIGALCQPSTSMDTSSREGDSVSDRLAANVAMASSEKSRAL